MTERGPKVVGYCPMCGSSSLFLDESGYATCSVSFCSSTAASVILNDPETEHVVRLYKDSFIVRHPLRERVGDALMDCQLGNYLASLDGPPRPPGKYRATPVAPDESGWDFVSLVDDDA